MATQSPVLPAYRQAFANPQRNSAVTAVMAPPRPLEPLIELGPARIYQSIVWLFGFRDGSRVSAVGHPNNGHVVQLSPAKSLGMFGTREGSWPVHAEDSDQLVLPHETVLTRPDMNNLSDVDAFQDTLGATRFIRALIARADGYIMLAQDERDRERRSDRSFAQRGAWPKMTYPAWSWRHVFPLVRAQLSPALSDDTLVVCLDDKLVYLSAQGKGVIDPELGVGATTVIAEVAAQLMPNLTSVDLQDRVWGFRASDHALLGWNARGESLGPALPLDVTPVQPPVALPDGALAIIAPGVALKVKDGAIVWRAPLPAGDSPLATADGAGSLAIRVGRQLWVLGSDGKRKWFAELPAVITSNPLITTTGRLCVATGLTLRCSS